MCLTLFQQLTNHMIEYAKLSVKENIEGIKVENETLKKRIVD